VLSNERGGGAFTGRPRAQTHRRTDVCDHATGPAKERPVSAVARPGKDKLHRIEVPCGESLHHDPVVTDIEPLAGMAAAAKGKQQAPRQGRVWRASGRMPRASTYD